MTKRFIIVGVIFGLLIGGLAFFHFVFLPSMIKQAILGSPKPAETISADAATVERWAPYVRAIGTVQATCLPAFSAARDCGAWSGMGELMWTASTLGSLSNSS